MDEYSRRVQRLQETVALRLLPDIRAIQRTVRATLVWTIACAVMLLGWGVAIVVLLGGR